MNKVTKIFLLFLIALVLTACQSYPKNAPECTGEFSSVNPDYIYNEKTEKAVSP